nr:glycosyltransferase family 9 protein [Patulibacter sp. SYSU D01012]
MAFACGPFPDGPAWDPDEHEVERWCRLLGAHGVPCDPHDLLLPRPEGRGGGGSRSGGGSRDGGGSRSGGGSRDGGRGGGGHAAGGEGAGSGEHAARGAVVLHPGAASGARRWPVERFAAVARALTAAGERVLLTGSPAEAGLAAELARRADLPDGACLAGRTDVLGLATVVADAACVVAGDTGVAHLATAMGTPSVLLFGPTPPTAWGPLIGRDPDAPRHLVLWAGRTGDPHADAPDPGLLEITPQAVLDGVRRVRATGPARRDG